MALIKNMTKDEIYSFIDNELIPQTKQEIQSLIHPDKKQGGYFVVTRQILCITDFLGAVYCGYSRKDRFKDSKGKNISTSSKAKTFIKDFFKPKNTYQDDIVNKLYFMYRHGLVHLYQPKYVKLGNKKVLLWFFYKGNRYQNTMSVDSNNGKRYFNNVDHLKVVPDGTSNKYYYLPICIDALYSDFELAVREYKNKLNYKKYQVRWRSVVNAICKPCKI